MKADDFLDDTHTADSFLDSDATVTSPAQPSSKVSFADLLRQAASKIPVKAIADAVSLGPLAPTKLLIENEANKAVANPKEYLNQKVEELPATGAIAGSLVPGGGTIVGAGVGELARQGIRAAQGKEPAGDVKIPFTNTNIPKPDGVPPTLANAIYQMGLAAPSEALESVSTGIKSLAKPISKIQALTGPEAQKFERVFHDPSVMLPPGLGGPKTIQAAGETMGAIEEARNIRPDVTAEKIFDSSSEAKRIGKAAFEKMQSGQSLTPKEALEARRAVDDVLPSLKGPNKKTEKQMILDFRAKLNNILSTQEGEFAAASKEYARALLRSDLLKILPVNKDGSYSIGRTALAKFIGSAALPISSPAIQAYGMAGLGAVAKALSNPLLRPAATSQVVNALTEEIKQLNAQRQKQQ
jgi:hypothetical protein